MQCYACLHPRRGGSAYWKRARAHCQRKPSGWHILINHFLVTPWAWAEIHFLLTGGVVGFCDAFAVNLLSSQTGSQCWLVNYNSINLGNRNNLPINNVLVPLSVKCISVLRFNREKGSVTGATVAGHIRLIYRASLRKCMVAAINFKFLLIERQLSSMSSVSVFCLN